MTQDEQKQRAARYATKYLPSSGVIGLGTGSTANHFIRELAGLVRGGGNYQGVPTSDLSRKLASELGLTLLPNDGPWSIAACFDGADEVSADLDLIKGGGASHTREKVVNYASKRNIIIVDESKVSERLGERFPVPVEVLAFGHGSTRKHLEQFGRVTLREKAGSPWLTDAGNPIYDVHTGPISDPADLDRVIRALPGVVETGLFVKRADVVIIAGESEIRELVSAQARSHQ